MDEATELEYLMGVCPTLGIALGHHRTHKNLPITFDDHPYLVDIYSDPSPRIVVQKSTQSGLSEWMLISTMARAIAGRSIFYVLPTEVLRNRYINNRVDLSIQYTKLYQKAAKGGEGGGSSSVTLKHIGKGAIAFVGSNSPAGFTEYPADDLFIDELDQCNQANLEMGWERLSASKDKRTIEISNPTVNGYGIDLRYAFTDKKVWEIKCLHCRKWFTPDFFKHVVQEVDAGVFVIRDKAWQKGMNRDIRPICECGKPYDRFSVGRWIPTGTGDGSGYQISKMFSTAVTIEEMIDRFSRGLDNPVVMQRFYNGDLGFAYTAAGAKITEDVLNSCVSNYNMPAKSAGPCVMGIDVGTFFHIRIDEVLPDRKLRAVYIGKVREEDEVVELFRRYNVRFGVIDAMPEKRIAKKIVYRTKRMMMCYYTAGKGDTYNLKAMTLSVDRTETLDYVKESLLTGQQILPAEAANIPEYYDQMTAATRVYDDDKQAYAWTEGSKPDHYHHAEAYKNLAYKYFILAK